ncbi:S1 family peptidase [Longispora urticae]
MEYSAAIAYVAVKDCNGIDGIGSAVHVGEGVFVTARHVVEGKAVTAVGFPAADAFGDDVELKLISGPFYHSDERVDVAAFKVAEPGDRCPSVILGDQMDDDPIDEEYLLLSEAIVMGYPPIPFTVTPVLIAARAEINAVISRRDTPNLHYILSAMARGGFSGGLALSEAGTALGIITSSLGQAGQPAELGYMAVVGVEPIYRCLAEHKLLPECQEERWFDTWSQEPTFYWIQEGENSWRGTASVSVFDNNRRLYLVVTCIESLEKHCEAKAAALDALSGCDIVVNELRQGVVRINIVGDLEMSRAQLVEAARAAAQVFAQVYETAPFDGPPSWLD